MPYLKLKCFYLISLLILSGCDFFANPMGESDITDKDTHVSAAQLSFAVAPKIAWMPWYLANEEGIFKHYADKYKIQFKIVFDNYQETIDQFLAKKVDAIAISNIDTFAQLIQRNIEADVILITNQSAGNDAILLPVNADSSVHNLRGKTFALVKYSSSHYLLERYLIRHQIPFDDVNILDLSPLEILPAFKNKKVHGIVTNNPNLHEITSTGAGKILFNSRQIPKEIYDIIIIHRDSLREHPEFAQVILASWFSVMERLQGNKRGPTLDTLAGLAKLTHQQYEEQLATFRLNNTSTKALAAIRDRRMKKSMRHLRYFIERHQLAGQDSLTLDWVSYPGRIPAVIHFNGQPLQHFVTPIVSETD